jgi:hypothetical protein
MNPYLTRALAEARIRELAEQAARVRRDRDAKPPLRSEMTTDKRGDSR